MITGIRTRRDHPRVCGEHSLMIRSRTCLQGSSPRMRGALSLIFPVLLLAGIIPAYAGSTVRHSAAPPYSRDHPRVCGEHSYRSAMIRSL